MQRQILFKCPRTGMNVQVSLDEEAIESLKPEDTYVSISCPACTSLHFVNSTTGRTLGDQERAPR
jgi:predicted RNA-binding Zn-ribbon protein involved in translation (DUF1610 family)